MRRFFIYFLVIFFISISKYSYTQVQLTHEVYWSTENQNMWGPNGSPFSLDMDIDLFEFEFDTSANFGMMDTVLGLPVGAAIDLLAWLKFGAYFSTHGFTTGSVDVDYPARIDLTFPDNYTFCRGEYITINSDYEMLPGWQLKTHFPEAGITTLWLEFGYGVDLDAIICVPDPFDPSDPCDTTAIFDLHAPTDSITVFHLNGQTGEVVYPCFDNGSLDFCHDSLLPIVIEDWWDIGLTGEITLPYVETTDYTDGVCLYAEGDSNYINLDLDVIKFIAKIAGFMGPQGQAIATALENLQGTYDLGIIQVEYNLLSILMDISTTMQQDFTFCPTVWTKLGFPTPLDYNITDPTNNDSLIEEGSSDTIMFQAGHDLQVKFPCFDYDELDVSIAHHLSNEFTNHTWDSIAFSVGITAFEFHIHLPFLSLPQMQMPEFCVDVPYPCNVLDTCYSQYCSPTIITPPTPVPAQLMSTIDIGPLIDLDVPLGYLPFTWYDNTWELAGFNDSVFPGITLATDCAPLELVSITGNDVPCSGDTSGSVAVTVTGGVPPYTYYWSNGETHTGNYTTDSIVNVGAGHYTVSVQDANECEVTDSIDIIEYNPPIYIDFVINDVACTGMTNGSVHATVSGGTPGYTYLWTPTGSTASYIDNQPQGDYILTVTDNVGCTETDTASIIEPDSSVIITLDSIKHVTCYGYNDGAVYTSVTGGTPNYSYTWNGIQNNEDIENCTAGDYILIATDINQCKDTLNITVTEPQPLIIDVNATNISCTGETDGSIDIVVSGGTPPYNYNWNTGQTVEDLTNLEVGVYTVTVTDANNCTSSATQAIFEPAPLKLDLTATDISCNGGNNGMVYSQVSGGTMPYNYLWNTGETSPNLIQITAGNYILTVTDSMGCTISDTISVNEPDEALDLTYTTTDNVCNGANGGAIDITITGGTPGYNYSWSNGSISEDINNLSAGSYSVTVSDNNNCSISETIVINEPDSVYLSPISGDSVCYGQPLTLNANLVYGGTPPYTIFWSNNMVGNTITLNPTSTQNLSVYAIDDNGCMSNTVTVLIYVYPPLQVDAYISNDTICIGDSVQINALISGGKGAPYNVYLNNNGHSINLPYTTYPDSSQNYTIIVEDGCNFNYISDVVSVDVMPLPRVDFYGLNTDGCAPLEVDFVNQNTQINYQYLWQFGDGGSSNLANPTHLYYNDGIYSVTLYATSNFGCTNSLTQTALVEVYETPIADFHASPNPASIFDPYVWFSNESSGGDYYYWSFGDGYESTDNNPMHQYNTVGIYTVQLIAESEHGCKDTTYQDIQVNDQHTLYIPNAFTPGEDGLNDEFKPKGTGIVEGTYHMMIFSRWGELVFESYDIDKGWDGTINGNPIYDNCIFSYVITYESVEGSEHKKIGSFSLVQNRRRIYND